MNPFLNILRLSAGDFLAKTLSFLAIIYLARVLGVSSYGVLEFSLSVVTYVLLMADGGLELWATREVSQGKDDMELVSRVVSLRLVLATGAFGILLAVLWALPEYPALRIILPLFGLTVFAQAFNLKWVFLGREKMGSVAIGLVLGQALFAASIFALVRSSAGIVWVPVLRLAADLAMAIYFFRLYLRERAWVRLAWRPDDFSNALRPALIIGAAHGLALLSFNFDSILVGFLLGAKEVGLYSAAYKPVTAVLALPVVYFIGLFPTLSRTYVDSPDTFHEIVARSFRLASIFALPVGAAGTFLAGPIIRFLFGPAYADSVPVLQVLSWSATFVILRGTCRQALNATGRASLDLRCAAASTAVNVVLNFLLIPRYGILGAAAATVMAEGLWLTIATRYLNRYVTSFNLASILPRPAFASLTMVATFWLLQTSLWTVQALVGTFIYFASLLILGDKEVRSWV